LGQEPTGLGLESISKNYQGPKKVFSFVGETLSMGDRISELLYGVLMVSAISGLVILDVTPDESGIEYMLVVLFITIILWGFLDGLSYALLSSANRAERETLVESLADGDKEKRRAAIESDLDDTFVARLDDESRAKIAKIVEEGLPYTAPRMEVNYLTKFEKSIILAAFILDFSALMLLVLPYLVFNDIKNAALVSHSMALIMFVIIGFYYAKFAHLNKWKGAFVCGLLGLILLVFAEVTNLVLI
jgi:VIT1/CCC1 family predicted Fe2+/Mn2+ transporter